MTTTTATGLAALHDVCREVIADLAMRSAQPTTTQIVKAIDRRVGARTTIPAQVHTQKAAGLVMAYFRYCHPGTGWRFTGRDLCPIADDTLLAWTDDHGNVMVDAVLTGECPSRDSLTNSTERTRHRASELFGDDLVLVRALVPRTPALSVLVVTKAR